jgi:hypothetical protein
LGQFFTAAEEALPEQLKGALNDAKQFVKSLYVVDEKPVMTELSRKYPGMKDAIAGAVVEQLRDWMFGNDLSLMSLDAASKQIQAIINAQTARELDVLRKDPETGALNYERRGGESEEALLARALKALENRELVWTDDKTGTLRYALGTEEGIAEAQSRLRERLAEKLKAEGIAPGEIGMEFTESAADRDKDAAPVFSARGKQYRFVSDGKKLALQRRDAEGEWAAHTPPVPTPPAGASPPHPDAAQAEIRNLVSRQQTATPEGLGYREWQGMINRGTAAGYLEALRKERPDAYNSYKDRLLGTGGRR